jgi:hypothetical protein
MTKEHFQEMDFASNKSKFFVYGENIRSMVLLCKGRNIDVLILDLPTSPDPNHYGKNEKFGSRFRELIGRIELELKKVAKEEGIKFVNTGLFDRDDFLDHCHNTASVEDKQEVKISSFRHRLGQPLSNLDNAILSSIEILSPALKHSAIDFQFW